MSDQQQENWPSIESQQSYWRTKEADLSLDKVEATTDYIDHFLAGNPTSEIPLQSNETDGFSIYPDDWPKCPSCGDPAMDGHITCGRASCNEGAWR